MRPPRCRPVVRIGVTGHRRALGVEEAPTRAVVRAAIEEATGALVDAARESKAFADLRPRVRVVSPLADGADRLVVEEALAIGEREKSRAAPEFEVEVQAPLPFEREIYRNDFDPASRARFDELIAGRVVLELDGATEPPDARANAYREVGRVVIQQCDLLLAVWDGEKPHGVGGTGEIVRDAVTAGIPTVWVHTDASRGHRACFLEWSVISDRPACGEGMQAVRRRLHRLIKPPEAKHGADWSDYFRERQPRLALGFLWALFRDFVGGSPRLPSLRAPSFERMSAAAWSASWPASPVLEPAGRVLSASLRPHIAFADGLANHFAGLYRSSFLVSYLFGAIAVLLALMPVALHWDDHAPPVFVVAELLVISFVIALILAGRRFRWHERWIDHRFLAELLRQIRFLAPLGSLRPFAPPPEGMELDARATWMHWHARAVAREVGLVPARLDATYRQAFCTVLATDLAEQHRYHESNAHRLGVLERRLRRGGVLLFALTFVACATHLRVHTHWLTLAAAVLPAFGAAFAGIRSHAELELTAHRSEAMGVELARLLSILTREGAKLPPAALRDLAERASDLMVEDALSWRHVSKARPLELAG